MGFMSSLNYIVKSFWNQPPLWLLKERRWRRMGQGVCSRTGVGAMARPSPYLTTAADFPHADLGKILLFVQFLRQVIHPAKGGAQISILQDKNFVFCRLLSHQEFCLIYRCYPIIADNILYADFNWSLSVPSKSLLIIVFR